MFQDKVDIRIRSGKGGDGAVSFRRELYVPNGGPDGGDGGRGGDLILEVDRGLNDLSRFRTRRLYAAGDGGPGGRGRCHGADGDDLVLKVPEGTLVKESESGLIVADMSGPNTREIILRGGRGGLGNQHFATASMQAPRYAEPGRPARELPVTLELKLIADVGLVGLPNVGKSTLLSVVSRARPEIADYHFTTLSPHLGVVRVDEDTSFVMADIPGLIEGASRGAGLGHDFLRHIERCRMICNIVDIAGTEGRDPLSDIDIIKNELERFSPALSGLPMVIVANKMDALPPDSDALSRVREKWERVYPISAATGEGVRELVYGLSELLSSSPRETLIYEREFDTDNISPEEETLRIYKEAPGVYVVEGSRIDRMLGYTRLDTERGMSFFQNYMRENGIIERLKDMGLEEEDTVRVGGMEFSYYE